MITYKNSKLSEPRHGFRAFQIFQGDQYLYSIAMEREWTGGRSFKWVYYYTFYDPADQSTESQDIWESFRLTAEEVMDHIISAGHSLKFKIY